ncbi:MAG: BatA domain-containing protein [Candidatus Cloacimonadia bacterium]
MFQLSFLNTSILFLTLAATVPILIYLFVAKKPRQVIFSTIRHIKASQQRQKSKIKLKNILLLIIRTLIILLTILAIARPAIKSPIFNKWAKHSPTAIAIILDTSYSMDYLVDTRTDLEVGKDFIKKINDKLTDKDVVTLITSDDEWNKLYANIHYGKIPESLLGNIELTALPTHLNDLVQLANDKLKETQLFNREIYLINNLRKQELPEKTEYPLLIIPTSDKDDWNNLSCQNARVEEDFIERKVEKRLAFELVNHSPYEQSDVVGLLLVNGSIVAEKAFNLNPFEKKTEYFDLQTDDPGWYSGFVSIRNERLQFDNKSYFSFYNEQNPQIAVISDDSKLPLPLSSVLGIYTKRGSNVRFYREDDLAYEKINDVGFVIVYDKKELTPKLRFLLDRLKEDNIGILHLPSKEITSNWQEYYQTVLGLSSLEFQQEQLRISYLNLYHPIFSIFEKSDQDRINLLGYWKGTLKGNANTLVQADTIPLVLENKREVIWLFDLNNYQSELLVDPLFPMMAYRTFLYCSNLSSLQTTVGQKITLPQNQVLLPGGELYTTNRSTYTVKQPGIYQIPEGKEENQHLAVNIEYNLSDFEKLTVEKHNNIAILDQEWESQIMMSRTGIEIWKHLFFLVLLLVIVEIILVKHQESRQ